MKKILMIITAITMTSVAVQATLVVDPGTLNFWNRIDAGVGANINFAMPTTSAAGNVRTYDNDFSTPIITNGATAGAANKSTYIGPSVYASFRHVDTANSTPPGVITVARSQVTGTAITPLATSGSALWDWMFVVKKADFANGLNAASAVGFSNTDGFSISTVAYNANAKSVRAVVLNNGVWYVSQAENTVAQAATNPKVILTDAASAQWAVFDPLTTIDYSTLNFTTTVAGSTFNNIQAVGVYGRMEKTTTAFTFGLDKLTIGATAIPEPATIGMFGFGALMVMVIRRRNMPTIS